MGRNSYWDFFFNRIFCNWTILQFKALDDGISSIKKKNPVHELYVLGVNLHEKKEFFLVNFLLSNNGTHVLLKFTKVPSNKARRAGTRGTSVCMSERSVRGLRCESVPLSIHGNTGEERAYTECAECSPVYTCRCRSSTCFQVSVVSPSLYTRPVCRYPLTSWVYETPGSWVCLHLLFCSCSPCWRHYNVNIKRKKNRKTNLVCVFSFLFVYCIISF